MARLVLVRHAETGCGGRMQGWTDAPLNSVGHAQVERLVERLAGEACEAVYCSDLQRARQTAAPLAGDHPLIVTPALREVSFGEWEDRHYADVAAACPRLAEAWQADPAGVAPPGGESLAAVGDRCAGLLPEMERHSSVLVVGHNAALRALLCRMLGLPLRHYWRLRLDHASVSVVDTYPEGPILSLLNDCRHLRGLEDIH